LTSSTPDLSLRHHRREQGLMLALASPALLVILLLIVLPVGWLAWQSIYHDGFTLENYRRIFSEDIYWRSFSLTFEISLLVTLLALLLGYPIAYAASAVPKGWSVLILALVILPFWTSVLVRAYAWLALLQRTGVINQFLQYLGIIEDPLALVHNTFGTVVATVHILLPFMVLPLYSVLKGIPPELMRAASSLGAPPWTAFRLVYVPQALPGIVAGASLVFVLALGYYVTPALVGGPGDQMIGYFIAYFTNTAVNWGMASALGTILLVVVSLIYLALGRVVGLDRLAVR
jgi:putative spermidine/putrescine transport system permease protein